MQIIHREQIPTLRNSGVESEQLLFPESSPEAMVTITRVTIPPGATSPRHMHAASEQVWLVISGEGALLLEGNQQTALKEGDVVRTAPGETHGFFNNSDRPFIYISVTTPPVNFRGAYAKEWKQQHAGNE